MKRYYILVVSLILLAVSFRYVYHVAESVQSVSRASDTTVVHTPVMSRPYASTTEIVRGDTTKKQVIFTFDGGSTIQSAQSILDVLKKHHVRGTFFLTGQTVVKYPELVSEIVRDGHEIFNHTYDHPKLTALSDDEITNELVRMNTELVKVTGVSSQPYFRAPYGDRDARVRTVAYDAGYQSVYWTVDALDWKEASGETNESVTQRILSHVSPGTIYLMHIGDTITGDILDAVFTEIESRGYMIVPLTKGI
jgi:peptidoglycan/xylan/chitin deacetylase (PgdA/CDA1 family)